MKERKLVVLDGYTTSRLKVGEAERDGEPGWDGLAGLSEIGGVEVYDRTAPEELIARARGAGLLITNKAGLDADTFAALSDLEYVGLLSTGTNAVDLDAARDHGVTVTNAPAYSTMSVAQHAFALLLELTNQTAGHAAAVADGRWSKSVDFCLTLSPLHELAGRTLGVVGFGETGQAVAKIAAAFGMAVNVYTRTEKDTPLDVTFVDRDTLWRDSDAVSLHCPLTDDTAGLVDADALSAMKNTAYLINTGRGGLVDEAALAEALRMGVIAGAGLDVLSDEPPAAEHPLVNAPRCVVTPHVAWATQAARRRLLQTVAGNVRAWLDGRPRNVVS